MWCISESANGDVAGLLKLLLPATGYISIEGTRVSLTANGLSFVWEAFPLTSVRGSGIGDRVSEEDGLSAAAANCEVESLSRCGRSKVDLALRLAGGAAVVGQHWVEQKTGYNAWTRPMMVSIRRAIFAIRQTRRWKKKKNDAIRGNDCVAAGRTISISTSMSLSLARSPSHVFLSCQPLGRWSNQTRESSDQPSTLRSNFPLSSLNLHQVI